MPRLTSPLLLLSFLTLTLNLSHASPNWPYWRGPDSNGVAADANPPTEWSEDKNVRWKVRIPGDGSGSPIIWGDQVFVQTAVKSDAGNAYKFLLLCLKRDTGEVVWQKELAESAPHEGHHESHAYGSHSPVTDGTHVVAFFGSQGVFGLSMEGDVLWERDLGDMTMRSGFGEGVSAALSKDTVVVPWDHEGPSAVYALNVKTGETIWETPRDEPSNWGSPLILQHNGQDQVILTGENAVRAYDLATGEELWRCGGQTTRPVSSPVTDGEKVYVGSGFRGSYLAAIRLGGKGNLTGTDSIIWDVGRNTPDIASLLLSGDRLYYTSAKSGIMTCCEAKTGKTHWGPERLPSLGTLYSSPAAAAGKVYVTSRDGYTVVLKDAEQFEVLATNRLDDTIDGSPAFSGDLLFLRGRSYLYCLAEE